MNEILSQKWLSRAVDDLAVARLVYAEAFYAHACFLSQQVIEKALKAVLLAKAGDYPRTHKLTDLLYACTQIDAGFSQLRDGCVIVDQYYVPTRYPDSVPGGKAEGLPGKAEAADAVPIAGDILKFVSDFLSS